MDNFRLIRIDSSAIVSFLEGLSLSKTSAFFVELSIAFFKYVVVFIDGVWAFLNTTLEEMVSFLALGFLSPESAILQWLLGALSWVADGVVLGFFRLIGIDTAIPLWNLLLISPLVIFSFVTILRIVNLLFGSTD